MSRRYRLMTGRPRTSTLVLIGLFLGVLALWILVRPVTAATNQPAVKTNPTPATVPVTHPRESPSPVRSATPSHSPTPSRHGTQSPRPSRTPTTSPTDGQTPPATSPASSPTVTTPVPASS